MKKRFSLPHILFIGLFLATGVVVTYRIIWCGGLPVREAEPPDTPTMSTARIQEQIGLLRDESLEDSLDRLDVMRAYRWPGYPFSGMIARSDDGRMAFDRVNLQEILSSRRFRKCWQELSRHRDAAVLLRHRLRETLASYSEVSQRHIEKEIGKSLNADDELLLIDLGVEGNETGDGSLIGLRYKVLALCLLASSLKADELTPELLAVAEVALQQKRYLENADSPRALPLIPCVSLYNTLILGTALYGISLPDRSFEAIEGLTEKWLERKLVDYSAPATEYDRDLIFVGREVTPDKEYVTVGYFEMLTDQEFEKLVQVVGDVRR